MANNQGEGPSFKDHVESIKRFGPYGVNPQLRAWMEGAEAAEKRIAHMQAVDKGDHDKAMDLREAIQGWLA